MTQRGVSRTLVAIVLGAALSPAAHSADLVQAWRDAVTHDAVLAGSLASLEAARERVQQARATLLPQASATGQVSRQTAENNILPRRDFTAQSFGVTMTVPLIRLQNAEAWEQSKLQASISEAQVEQARQDLMVRVAQAYFDVLAAQDNLATIRAQKAAISEQLASAKRNFEVGTATVTDQQEAQARYDLTAAQELASENDLTVKRAALSLLTGKPAGEMKALPRGVGLRDPEPAVESKWTESARTDNLLVQQATLAVEVSRREITRQRAGDKPTLDLTSTLQHSRSATLQLFGVNTSSGSLGVQLNIPFYTGGLVEARAREAIALNTRAAADLENARRQAEQGTRTAFLGVRSGLGQVRALEAAERSSQLALESNQLGYQVGVRINIDVLNAQQQLFTTRRDLSKARYDVLLNGLRLKQGSGSLREDDLAEVNRLLTAAPGDAVGPSASPASRPLGSGAGSPPAQDAMPAGGREADLRLRR